MNLIRGGVATSSVKVPFDGWDGMVREIILFRLRFKNDGLPMPACLVLQVAKKRGSRL